MNTTRFQGKVLQEYLMESPFIRDKLTTAEEALAGVKPGDRIFIGTACATPRELVRALEGMDKELDDVVLFHFLTQGAIPHEHGMPKTRFQHKVFFVGSDAKEAIKQGKADYIPVSIAQLPKLIEKGSISFDVACIQVSMPDLHGYVSLGVSVDITMAAALNAKTVIAELNPNMPYTLGESFLPVDKIDRLVLVDRPVIEYQHKAPDAIAEQIARYVARIIDDNSTLQIGLGQISIEMLKYLTNRTNLGIHSDVITDNVVDLIEKGVITGEAKSKHKRRVVASYCMGTKRLYQFIDKNPMFSFHPIDYVCDPAVISQNKKMVSVTQAFAIDLMGQVCADQFGGDFYSGVSTQPDFLRGAGNSPGGKPIICLASATEDGKESRIRPLLLEGEGVTIPRSDVHYVVTEYGIAYLFCKSIHTRALSLIEIAHPSFRPWLLEEAKRLGYLRQDQTLKSKKAYPEMEERDVMLKNGKKVLIRPSKASDVEKLQNIFYDLSPEDIRTRFFRQLSSLPVSRAQHLCNVDYENEMAFVAVAGERENESVVGTSCYFVDHSDNLGEVTYMILPEWQGFGLGTALQKRMMEYAQNRGLRGFKANILISNSKMLRLIQQIPNVSVDLYFDQYEVVTHF